MPQHRRLDAPHGLPLRDAGIGDPVHVPLEQRLLVFRAQLPVMRHALVAFVGHEVEDVLLQVRPGARDGVHLVLADHLGQGDPQLRRRHRAGQGDQHLVPGGEMAVVVLRRRDQRRGIEVAVVVLDELGDRSGHGGA